MTDYTELKRLAEACGDLNWRAIQENWCERAIRDDHGYIATMRTKSAKHPGPCPAREAKAKFLCAVTPAAVLALIAENEALAVLLKRFVDGEHDHEENQAERHMYFTEAQSLLALVDGELEAHTIVPDSAIKAIHAERDQLKAENVALLSALKGMASMYGHCWDLVDGGLLCMQHNVQRFEEAHEAAQKVIAAMVKESSHD